MITTIFSSSCSVFKSFIHRIINSLPNDKILEVTKLKAFTDDNLNIAKMTISLFNRVETLWKKEKKLVTSIFSFSNSVF